jgi:uncharacterized protein YeaO (DUF488 family)
MVNLKRVYEEPSPDDGCRVLVERLWPRGLTKERAAVDVWLKDLSPSPELRKWFGHDPERWEEFQQRYRGELREKLSALEELREMARGKTVTLVFAARDEEHNSARILAEVLRDGEAEDGDRRQARARNRSSSAG